MALSLGSPPPDVIRRRFSVEPGLSSIPWGTAAIQPTDVSGITAGDHASSEFGVNAFFARRMVSGRFVRRPQLLAMMARAFEQ